LNQENQLSLIAVIVLVTFIGYVTYRRSKEAENLKSGCYLVVLQGYYF
jgi:hypothetical protein